MGPDARVPAKRYTIRRCGRPEAALPEAIRCNQEAQRARRPDHHRHRHPCVAVGGGAQALRRPAAARPLGRRAGPVRAPGGTAPHLRRPRRPLDQPQHRAPRLPAGDRREVRARGGAGRGRPGRAGGQDPGPGRHRGLPPLRRRPRQRRGPHRRHGPRGHRRAPADPRNVAPVGDGVPHRRGHRAVRVLRPLHGRLLLDRHRPAQEPADAHRRGRRMVGGPHRGARPPAVGGRSHARAGRGLPHRRPRPGAGLGRAGRRRPAPAAPLVLLRAALLPRLPRRVGQHRGGPHRGPSLGGAAAAGLPAALGGVRPPPQLPGGLLRDRLRLAARMAAAPRRPVQAPQEQGAAAVDAAVGVRPGRSRLLRHRALRGPQDLRLRRQRPGRRGAHVPVGLPPRPVPFPRLAGRGAGMGH